jgi:hypothetical protein
VKTAITEGKVDDKRNQEMKRNTNQRKTKTEPNKERGREKENTTETVMNMIENRMVKQFPTSPATPSTT